MSSYVLLVVWYFSLEFRKPSVTHDWEFYVEIQVEMRYEAKRDRVEARFHLDHFFHANLILC